MGLRYYARRLSQAVITFLTGMFITYALYRFIPGGPLQQMKNRVIQRATQQGRAPDPERIARLTEMATGIDPDQGVIVGFLDYIYNAVVLQQFGESIAFGDPVFDILFRAMPWSMFISIYGLILGFTTMILLGTIMAWKEGTKIDQGITVFVMVMNSIPYYVGAILMLAFLGYEWGLFPTGGRYPTSVQPGFTVEFMVGVVRHAALPILSAFVVGFGGGSIQMRSLGVRVIGADYLRSARIRGLRTNRILTRYIARNTILPVYTGLMIGVAGIFSSSVILERIFQYPGVGWYLFEAFTLQDYPLIMGSFIFLTGITVIGILVADLTYGLIDPRAGDPSEREAY